MEERAAAEAAEIARRTRPPEHAEPAPGADAAAPPGEPVSGGESSLETAAAAAGAPAAQHAEKAG